MKTTLVARNVDLEELIEIRDCAAIESISKPDHHWTDKIVTIIDGMLSLTRWNGAIHPKRIENPVADLLRQLGSYSWDNDFFVFCQDLGFDPSTDYAKDRFAALSMICAQMNILDTNQIAKLINIQIQKGKR